jgi:hypothetical protein
MTGLWNLEVRSVRFRVRQMVTNGTDVHSRASDLLPLLWASTAAALMHSLQFHAIHECKCMLPNGHGVNKIQSDAPRRLHACYTYVNQLKIQSGLFHKYS